MSTIGITTDLISQGAGLPSAANEFVTDLNRLAQDLQNGDLAAVRTDYVLFSESVLGTIEPVPVPTSNPDVTTSLSASADTITATDTSGTGTNPAGSEPVPVTPIEHTGQSHSPTPVASPSVSESPALVLSLHA